MNKAQIEGLRPLRYHHAISSEAHADIAVEAVSLGHFALWREKPGDTLVFVCPTEDVGKGISRVMALSRVPTYLSMGTHGEFEYPPSDELRRISWVDAVKSLNAVPDGITERSGPQKAALLYFIEGKVMQGIGMQGVTGHTTGSIATAALR